MFGSVVFDVIYGIMFPLLAGGFGLSGVMPGVEVLWHSTIMFPIIFGIWGCIGGAITALLFNFFAKKNRRYSGQSCAEIPPLLFFCINRF